MSVAPTPLPHRPELHRPPAAIVLTVVAVLAAAAGLAILAHRQTSTSSSPPVVIGSGVVAVETRALPPFTGITMGGSGTVVVQVGRAQQVVVTADDNLVDHVKTTVRGGALTIATPGSFRTVSPIRVAITVPRVDRLRLSGTGAIDAMGATPRLAAILDGTGALRLGPLVARDVTATLSGTGAIRVTATRSLRADLPGTGQIVYGGFPEHVTQTITGTGAVTMGPR